MLSWGPERTCNSNTRPEGKTDEIRPTYFCLIWKIHSPLPVIFLSPVNYLRTSVKPVGVH